MRCPCDSGADHAACCGRFLDGHQRPATPEELMRSRYSAYVRGDVDYLLRTHAEETRPERRSLERSVEGATFVKLVVEEADGDHVTFAAHYLEGGVERVLRERSRFVRREGQWLYVDGEVTTTTVPLARAAEAVGRNAPCPCGSGKKYKRCHGG